MVVIKGSDIMSNVNNKKNSKDHVNVQKVSNGKINTKKVFARKDNVRVEDISIDEALSSRVSRNKKLYSNKSSESKEKKLHENNSHEIKSKENFSNTKQQKFNFENKKIKIEDDMDSSFFNEKKKNKSKVKEKISTPVSIKVEDIPIKKVLKKNKKSDSSVVIMLFLAVIIVFMGVFLIYHFGSFDHDQVKKNSIIKKVEVVPENIVFLGDSITYQYDIEKFYSKRNVVNSGINGNTTQNILDDMKNRVYRYNPSHVILLIGTNDLNNGESIDKIVGNIEEIIKDIKIKLPKTKIYLESVYPINNTDDKKIDHEMVGKRSNEDIKKINKELKKVSKKEKVKYINMYSNLVDDDGNLNLDYTKEGLHINDDGYDIITFEINKLLKNQ